MHAKRAAAPYFTPGGHMLQSTYSPPVATQSTRPVLYLALGAVAAIKLNVIGDVFVGEFIAACYALALLSTLRIPRAYVTLLALTLMWAAAQAMSDVVNGTPLMTSLKGVLAPGVFFLTIYAIGNHFGEGSSRRIWFFLIGLALSEMVSMARAPTEDMLFNPWKWGYASPVLILLLAYLSMARAGMLRIMVCLGAYAVVSAIFDFRSAAGLPLIALLVYFGRRSALARYVTGVVKTPGGIAAIFVALAVAMAALNSVLSVIFAHAGDFGFLTPEAVHKYTVQATSELGILLGGRSEILVSVRAFLDSPWLGHGSWAVDRNGYQDAYSVLVYQMGASLNDKLEVFDNDLIPAHSFLMGGLVWSGILGGVFWICLMGRALAVFVRNMRVLPIYFFVMMAQLVWDIFFSPFSAEHRWGSAVFVGLLFAWHHGIALREGKQR
ncbi:hypothetical protein CURE108131_10220 [Cupriavidus respiraculi]|uniref:O-antigen ligase domain-containing protein n=2 Tax=Cupriavidus respiraculi TaxID=195930 RepID=A0ABN7Y7G3_9BURK|nr:hypothetical protein LMG21510_01392 [Cupriavidus respiraculi]